MLSWLYLVDPLLNLTGHHQSQKSPKFLRIYLIYPTVLSRIKMPKRSHSTIIPATAKPEYYSVMYRSKPSAKKHQTWDCDGFLAVDQGSFLLLDSDGKQVSKSRKTQAVEDGIQLSVGGKELEVQGKISRADFEKATGSAIKVPSEVENIVPVAVTNLGIKNKPFYLSFKSKSKTKPTFTPRFDPLKEGAVVMPKMNATADTVDVVLDPHLSSKLKDHQKTGVQFLYSSVMGISNPNQLGCILADAMGLGKSLQAIALIWTLLKQTPFGGKRSVAKRILLVCPASLLKNWAKEFKRWLGDERIKVYTPTSKNENLKDYLGSFIYPVLLLNYEKLIKYKDNLIDANFDLIVCDEGHRLKNSDVKASKILVSLQTKRRIILTGTPLQNDLMEFYEMVEFVNPGSLGSPSLFKAKFESVIVKARAPNATAYERRKGCELAKELFSLTDSFILRRSSDTNSDYLPPKTEFVLFCQLNSDQSNLYQDKIEEITLNGSNVFSDLSDLRKLSNSVLAVDSDALYTLSESSAKFEAIVNLLDALKPTGEKVVLVSHWTSILNLFEKHLEYRQMSFSRLDGSTSISDRQSLVDNFNSSTTFCFLLSSKAGGVGLNLVGASRLVMVDIDWNPSVDAQAMARIWRPGQSRPCFIYRFIAAGTIEEYIYQRQLEKGELSAAVMTGRKGFSREEVKEVFGFQESSTCRTHEMMNCRCLDEEDNVRSVVDLD